MTPRRNRSVGAAFTRKLCPVITLREEAGRCVREDFYSRQRTDGESRMRVDNPTKTAARRAALRATGLHCLAA
jgi:hypothetical protein